MFSVYKIVFLNHIHFLLNYIARNNNEICRCLKSDQSHDQGKTFIFDSPPSPLLKTVSLTISPQDK